MGSGKTKVILPLLCQTFLSNNAAAHKALARGGELKHVLVILVPEHLVLDARDQARHSTTHRALSRGAELALIQILTDARAAMEYG